MTAPLPRSCPACDGTAATRIDQYSPPEWDVVACNRCGFVYLQNPPEYEALEEDYAWEKTYVEKTRKGGSTPFSRANRWLRTRLGLLGGRRETHLYPALFGAGRVLDIGCGNVVRARPPITPYGIELSRKLHAEADSEMRARGGYCLQEAGAEGVWKFDADFFDGAILHSYLEHEAQPMRVLQGLHRALKPGGKIIARMPNYGSLNRRAIGAKWCGFRHPDHVNYFTPASLAAMADRAGFSTRILNRANIWLDDNIQAVLTKRAAPTGSGGMGT
ncbi:MAG: class I SAM-dependent methyltransferase [Rhodobacteraceae bacterium]|nr:class I SAM-dependent methyltransferase [Paracoccaceae bacterium]